MLWTNTWKFDKSETLLSFLEQLRVRYSPPMHEEMRKLHLWVDIWDVPERVALISVFHDIPSILLKLQTLRLHFRSKKAPRDDIWDLPPDLASPLPEGIETVTPGTTGNTPLYGRGRTVLREVVQALDRIRLKEAEVTGFNDDHLAGKIAGRMTGAVLEPVEL